MYKNGQMFGLSHCTVYKLLAIWIRIYGEQHFLNGVVRHQLPLRDQLVWYRNYCRNAYPDIACLGIRFMDITTTQFLLDSQYSKQLSSNFKSLRRNIGNAVAGDENMLHFQE